MVSGVEPQAQGERKVTPPIRLGLAGVGSGARAIIEALPKVDGYRLTAVADIRREAREEFAREHDCEAFDSVEAMCKSPNLDAIYVGTPNQFHTEHTILGLRNGKHVICEKIMALTLADAQRMVEAAETNGVKLMAAHTVSFFPPIRHMRQIVSSGELGRVIQIAYLSYTPWLLRPRLPEETNTSHGGGVCYRQAPHEVDIVRLIGGGMVRSIRAHAGRHHSAFPCEGDYNVFFDFEDGATGSIVFNGYGFFNTIELTSAFGGPGGKEEPAGPQMRLRQALREGASKDDMRSGESGRLERPYHDEVRQPFFGLVIVSCERGDLRQTRTGIMIYNEHGAREVPTPKWDGALKVELEDFYASLTQDTPMPHDGRWGMATVETCLAILESSRERREIFLEHQVPSPF